MSSHRLKAQQGNGMTECLVALLALAPFLAGIPLLGKQLDIKHKTYDSARYSVWERTVWANSGPNRKVDADIALEARDRTLGSPLAGILETASLRVRGITENPLWRDRSHRRLLDYDGGAAPVNVSQQERASPVDVGYWFVPGVAHGEGVIATIASGLQVSDLQLNPQAFVAATVSVGVRPMLSAMAERPITLGQRGDAAQAPPQLVQRAAAAILSDTWSARDEDHLRGRVDDVTTNELIEDLELPGRPIGLQALGKGQPLYGEGQFGWDPDLRPRSATLPGAYVRRD